MPLRRFWSTLRLPWKWGASKLRPSSPAQVIQGLLWLPIPPCSYLSDEPQTVMKSRPCSQLLHTAATQVNRHGCSSIWHSLHHQSVWTSKLTWHKCLPIRCWRETVAVERVQVTGGSWTLCRLRLASMLPWRACAASLGFRMMPPWHAEVPCL